jgi:Holliday junction resolvase-like predicted endonuclease
VDARSKLLGDLSVEILARPGEIDPVALDIASELRRRFSLVHSFALSDQVRQAALEVNKRLTIYIRRAASLWTAAEDRQSERLDRTHAAYGETQHALERLVEAVGGPPAPGRDVSIWALEDD